MKASSVDEVAHMMSCFGVTAEEAGERLRTALRALSAGPTAAHGLTVSIASDVSELNRQMSLVTAGLLTPNEARVMEPENYRAPSRCPICGGPNNGEDPRRCSWCGTWFA